MKIIVDEKLTDYQNENLKNLDQFWRELTKQLFSENRIIQHVDIDGKRYYSDYEKIIVNNFNTIKKVHISTISEKEFFELNLIELNHLINGILNNLDHVSGAFYGEMKQQEWENFREFIQALTWMHQMLSVINQIGEKSGILLDQIDFIKIAIFEIEKIVRQINENIEIDDMISVGDILEYELRPLLLKMEKQISSEKVN